MKLQLIRKPDRDWNLNQVRITEPEGGSYNSLENPIGIETRASSPIGTKAPTLQLIRKPDRDWNPVCNILKSDLDRLQLIRKPDRDWNVGGPVGHPVGST